MSYQVVTNFAGGLDARKFFLSLPAGTLTQLINGHITQGGEIEKRKEFYQIALPSGNGYTFGAQESDSGILVFGSVASSTTWSGGTLATLPSPFIYQQLVYPANGTHASGAYAMTGVLWSTLFGDSAFVIATFADSSVWCFYGGVVIPDFFQGGRSINFTSNATIAASLVAMINAANVGYVAAQVGSTAVFNVTSPAGSNYSVSDTLETVSGTLTNVLNNTAIPGTTGLQAQGSFQIMAGTPAYASQTLTNDGTQPADASTVTIGVQTYRWKTTPTQAYDVFRGASATAAMTNLYLAINASGVAGTNYFAGTLKNTQVTATNPTATTVVVTAIASGSGSNSIVTTQAGTSHGTWGAGTLAGGNASAITNVTAGSASLLNGGTQIDFVTDIATTAAAVATSINANSGIGYTASSNGGIVTILAAAVGTGDNGQQISVTTKGTVCIGNFQFVFSGTGFTVPSFTVNGVSIISGTPSYTSAQTLAQFMQSFVNNINALTAASGYLACFSNGICTVSQVTTTSSDIPLTASVTVTPTGSNTGVISYPSNTVVLSSVNVTELVMVVTGSALANYSTTFSLSSITPAIVTPSGGTAPYTYQWAITDSGGKSSSDIKPSTPIAASTIFKSATGAFKIAILDGQAISKSYLATCTVTDLLGNFSVSSPVSLIVSIPNPN